MSAHGTALLPPALRLWRRRPAAGHASLHLRATSLMPRRRSSLELTSQALVRIENLSPNCAAARVGVAGSPRSAAPAPAPRETSRSHGARCRNSLDNSTG